MSDSASPPSVIARATAWALRLTPVRAFLLYSERRGPALADSVTYRALFGIFAGVLLGFSIAALWLAGNPAAWQALIDAVDAAIPGLVGEDGIVDPSTARAPVGLTIAGILSLVGLVGAAIGAVGSLRTALRTLSGVLRDDTFFLWVMLRNLAIGVGMGLAVLASAALTFLGTAGIDILTGWLGFSTTSAGVQIGTRVLSIAVILALDIVIVAVLFLVLSGVKAPPRALWSGAAIGGAGLIVLQQLSGLFVGGAANNPLLASFASLIALLLWVNLSVQVILVAGAYIIVRTDEAHDRVRARFGASTLAQRRVKQAEESVRLATDELQAARDAEEKERTSG